MSLQQLTKPREGLPFIPQARRVARLQVTPEALVLLLKELQHGHDITCSGLPSDARVVGSWFDTDGYGKFVIELESEAFEPVVYCAHAPFMNVMFTDHGPRGIPDSA